MTAVDYLPALRADYEARLSQWSDIQQHLPELHDTVTRYTGARVLELGVRFGNSTSALLAAAAVVGGHVWSVDIAPPAVTEWWAGTGLWTLTVGDDIAPDVVARQPEQVDVLFIDSSHTYTQTAAELATYVPRVAPGGTVLMHDMELIGPDAAYIRPGDPAPEYPVALAVAEYCQARGLVYEVRTGCYGLGVIAIPAQ